MSGRKKPVKGGFLKPKLTEELIEVMCGLKA